MAIGPEEFRDAQVKKQLNEEKQRIKELANQLEKEIDQTLLTKSNFHYIAGKVETAVKDEIVARYLSAGWTRVSFRKSRMNNRLEVFELWT